MLPIGFTKEGNRIGIKVFVPPYEIWTFAHQGDEPVKDKVRIVLNHVVDSAKTMEMWIYIDSLGRIPSDEWIPMVEKWLNDSH